MNISSVLKSAGLFFSVLILVCAAGSSVSNGADSRRPSAEETIKNFRAAVKALKSYSFNLHCLKEGDEFVKERHRIAMKEYEPIISKIEMLTRKKMGTEPRETYESVSGMQVIKPFRLQIAFTRDDYLPELLNGARGYYDPAVNDSEIFFKEPLVGLVFRRPLKDNDSGSMMVVNWTFNMIELDCALANGGAAKVIGSENYDGRPAWILEVEMKEGKTPWKMPCGKDGWGVPKAAWIQIDRELTTINQRIKKYGDSPGVMKYWIDQKSWLSVRKELRFGNKTVVRHRITDIVLNRVDEKKLLKAKKK